MVARDGRDWNLNALSAIIFFLVKVNFPEGLVVCDRIVSSDIRSHLEHWDNVFGCQVVNLFLVRDLVLHHGRLVIITTPKNKGRNDEYDINDDKDGGTARATPS